MTSIRESVAYKQYEERFAPAERELQQPRPVRTPRRRKKRAVRRGTVAGIGIAAIAATGILWCQMQLTQLTAAMNTQKSELNELASVNVTLNSKRAHEMDLDDVEDYVVENLGMVKMDSSQIEYIELTSPDNITVTHPGLTVRKVLDKLAEGFTVILEYIS